MADDKISLEIVLEDGSIKKAFATIQKEGEKASDGISKSFSSRLVSSFSVVGAAITGAVAAIGSGVALKSFVNAGIESEKAWRGFNAALSSTGQFSRQASESFQTYASELQNITGIQDEVIASGAALLVNVGRLSTDALPKATQAALDLGAALQIGPEQAFSLVAKAATGNVEALSRYGIRIDENIPKGERFAAVLKLIEDRFSGQASAATKTFEGALARLSNSFGDIGEEIGKLVTSSPAVIAVLNQIAGVFQGFAARVAALGKQGDILKPFVDGAIRLGQVLNSFVIAPLEIAFNAAGFFARAFVTGLQTIQAALGQVGVGILNVLDAVGLKVGTDLSQRIRQFAEQSAQDLVTFSQITAESFTQIGQTPLSDKITEFNLQLIEAINTSAFAGAQISQNLKNGTDPGKEALKDLEERAKSVNRAMNSALAGGIASAVQNMTNSLIKGTFSFQNFGKAVLGILGDMAIQVGTVAIGTGIAMQALGSLTPGAAIAAGIGLIALGTILKSFAGGEGGLGVQAGTNFSAGGGQDTAGNTPGLIDNSDQLERERQQTAVTVNIQGNVLDRRETGLAIAEIIAESFDLNGTRIVTGAA